MDTKKTMKEVPARRKFQDRPERSPRAPRGRRRGKESGFDRMVQKREGKISDLEDRLESGDYGGARRTRAKIEAQLEKARGSSEGRRSGKDSGFDRMAKREQQEKSDKISELEGILERGDFKPRQTRSKVEAQLEGLLEAPQRRGSLEQVKADSFAQAVEDAMTASPSMQRDRSESGERIRQGQVDKQIEDMDVEEDSDLSEAISEETGNMEVSSEAEDQVETMMDEEPMSAPEPESMLRAEPVPEMDEAESGRLFKMIMGSSFDPVSSMDKGKMEILKKAKAENPDLTDSQLALKIYRDYM